MITALNVTPAAADPNEVSKVIMLFPLLFLCYAVTVFTAN